MPTPAMAGGTLPSPSASGDDLRDALLARVRAATARAWADQDAALDAEIAALEAAGDDAVPSADELGGLAPPDPLAGPPDGEYAWLADLPGPLLEEYLAATAKPAGPEPIAAGWWDRAAGDGAGFASGGAADALRPGPVLAGLAADVHAAGLGRLTDDELVGVLRAGRRLQSWSAWLELSAASELMGRRLAQEDAGEAGLAEHADAEVAAALTLTGRAADGLLDLAMALRRLPLTSRALAAGAIDLPRAMVIADEVTALGDEHLAEVEQRVLAHAAGQTTSRLRAATRRAVLAADASAARQRQEKAQREARVERWAEHAGTAALAGRDLPPAEALVADQHLSELARALRAAGLTGTVDQLRARVFLTLLSGQPVNTLLPASGPSPGEPGSPGVPAATGPPGPPATGGPVLPDRPALTGTINLTMPLSAWIGLSQSPGDVTGLGPLSADDCRRLGEIMGTHPRTRWCLTLLDKGGHPVAHGCARPGRGLRGPPGGGAGPPSMNTARPPPVSTAGPPPVNTARSPSMSTAGPPPGSTARPPRVDTPSAADAWVARIPLQWLERGECSHRRESASYRPPPSLQHLIRIRQQLCAYPGCGRAARRCDLDHTIPYHRGGRTCECNLAPLCREHHQAKQTRGWSLAQPQPGVLVWTTPSGRSYTTYPSSYPE